MAPRDPELTRLLIQELARHLRELLAQVDGDASAPLEPTRRAVHALKGSAGLAGEPELAAVMQRLERRLSAGDAAARAEVFGVIEGAISRLEAGEHALESPWPVPPPELGGAPIDPLVKTQYVAEISDRLARIDELLGFTSDPISTATTLFRHLHTMKGASSAAGDEPMAWFCHGLEERVRGAAQSEEAARQGIEAVAKHRATLGALLDDPDAALAALRGTVLRRTTQVPQSSEEERREASFEPRVSEDDATIRVAAQSVDRLFDHVGGIAVAREPIAASVARAANQAAELRRLRADLAEALRLIGPPRPWGAPAAALRLVERATTALAALGETLDRGAEELAASDQALKDNAGAARKLLGAMRQTPIRGLFARLEASALAEARRTGRRVSVRTYGADEPIDRRLAEQLFEPFLQLARNAVAHGIQTPEAREARGAPAEAQITFGARRQGSRLLVTIVDDGMGVDTAELRTRAVEAGIVSDAVARAADDASLLELLFLPGFSTNTKSADLVSGRGIGLDITLAAVQKLGGNIRLSSRLGGGFEARVDLPAETGLGHVMWVTAAGVDYAIPALHARGVRVNDRDDADRIPHLAACLEGVPPLRAPFVLDVSPDLEGQERMSLGVDAVGTTEEVLIRALSPLMRSLGPFAGVIARGDGSLRLALDLSALAPRLRLLGRSSDPGQPR